MKTTFKGKPAHQISMFTRVCDIPYGRDFLHQGKRYTHCETLYYPRPNVPVANAVTNQADYVWIDGFTEVTPIRVYRGGLDG